MTPPKQLTARELELAGLVWQCFVSEPKVNYQKFCEVGGFKNSASASTVWLALKKKLIAGANGAAKTAPKSAGKRKKEATLDDTETPTKKVRATSSAKAKAPPANEPVESDDEQVVEWGDDSDY